MQAAPSSLVERNINQTTEVVVISIEPGSLLVFFKMSVRSLILRRNRSWVQVFAIRLVQRLAGSLQTKEEEEDLIS